MPFHRIQQPVYFRTPPVPTDPDWGLEAPVDPGYGIPTLPHPGGGPIVPPVYPSGGPIKPPGRPILPPRPENGLPPNGHPWLPGHWEPIDPGFGQPPIFGFIPVDPGFGFPVAPPRPDNTLPGTPGHWVPVDPDFGKPVGPCGGHDPIPHPPIWAWVPEVGPDFGLKPANPIAPTPEPK